MATTTHPHAAKEITQYINSLPEFSKKICLQLRSIIQQAVPDIIEDWKWGPHYRLEGMVCGYGAARQFVKFTFFNGSAMKDSLRLFDHCIDNEFSRSIKINNEKEINRKQLIAYIKESVAVNKKGFKRSVKDKTLVTPADLQKALSRNKVALKNFEALSYGYKKDYINWIESAKKEETRNTRIEKTVGKSAVGKKMNDK